MLFIAHLTRPGESAEWMFMKVCTVQSFLYVWCVYDHWGMGIRIRICYSLFQNLWILRNLPWPAVVVEIFFGLFSSDVCDSVTVSALSSQLMSL